MFSLLDYDLFARWTRAGEGTNLGEERRNMRDEAQVKLGGDSEDDVLYGWKKKPIEDSAYSKWKVSSGFEKFEGEDFYFKNAMTVQVLEDFMGYWVE